MRERESERAGERERVRELVRPTIALKADEA